MDCRSCIRIIAVALTALALGACDRAGDERVATAPMASADAVASAIAQPAWLRDRLPDDSFAYLRVPSASAMLALPTGRPSDALYASQAQVDAVASIRAAFLRNDRLADASGGLLPLLASLDAPIELAVYAQGRIASPAANVLVSLRLRSKDSADVEKLLAAVLDDDVAKPRFDAAGKAQIEDDSLRLYLHFDQDSQRLSILGGMFAHAGSLDEALQATAGVLSEPHPLLALEAEVPVAYEYVGRVPLAKAAGYLRMYLLTAKGA